MEDEEKRIQHLLNTNFLEVGFLPSGGGEKRIKGGAGRSKGGRPVTTPPDVYVCRRCRVAGHFIQHCPTNGDPNYDVKVPRLPTGIPKSPTRTAGIFYRRGILRCWCPTRPLSRKKLKGPRRRRRILGRGSSSGSRREKSTSLSLQVQDKSFSSSRISSISAWSHRQSCNNKELEIPLCPSVAQEDTTNSLKQGTKRARTDEKSNDVCDDRQATSSALNPRISNQEARPTKKPVDEVCGATASSGLKTANKKPMSSGGLDATAAAGGVLGQNIVVAGEEVLGKKKRKIEMGRSRQEAAASESYGNYYHHTMPAAGFGAYNPYWPGMGMQGYEAYYPADAHFPAHKYCHY
ncbi:hypothetical protein Tsubulata_019760 [Turnera subulata]|uniref:Zinc knuckle CX2CX3GHX4C domain-containing protein n=1 Tax=Turnera subulata TaxID=218843 RepID=A0A9Q0J0W0_9ROSI|nr:hypothetical protein Tsubulata_019760 [Turnera subulata]